MATRVMIAVFSYNRPNLLRLGVEALLRTPFAGQLCIFDDCSDDEGVLAYLEEVRARDVHVTTVDSGLPRANYHQRAARCAMLRSAALAYFISQPEQFDYVLFKDDDVLVTIPTVLEAVRDFQRLKETEWAHIGALTLHGLATHKGYLQVEDRVFTELDITGEANVLFGRAAIATTGNYFEAVNGGFADTQFWALRRAGFKYYDRVWLPYRVQHLGISPGSSTIHQAERFPDWNKHLYECVYKRRGLGQPLQVPGLDNKVFTARALAVGAEEAAREILENKDETFSVSYTG